MKAMNEVIPTARDTETSTSAMTVSNLNGTGFDIGSLGMAHSETGAPFMLPHPLTGGPIMGEDGTPVTVTLLSMFTPQYQEVARQNQLEQTEFSRIAEEEAAEQNKGRSDMLLPIRPDYTPTFEMLRKWDINYLIACTVAWNFTKMDGEDFPCTPKNRRRFWEDARFAHWRVPALNFMVRAGNFINGGSPALPKPPNSTSG